MFLHCGNTDSWTQGCGGETLGPATPDSFSDDTVIYAVSKLFSHVSLFLLGYISYIVFSVLKDIFNG